MNLELTKGCLHATYQHTHYPPATHTKQQETPTQNPAKHMPITHAEYRQMMMFTHFPHVVTPQVRRAHYHDFMLDVHAQLHAFRGDADPLLRVADAIAKVTD